MSTTDQIAYSALIVTGRQVDMTIELADALEGHFREAALRYGVDRVTTFHSRLDGGSSIRTASEGVGIVYGIIRWGGRGFIVHWTVRKRTTESRERETNGEYEKAALRLSRGHTRRGGSGREGRRGTGVGGVAGSGGRRGIQGSGRRPHYQRPRAGAGGTGGGGIPAAQPTAGAFAQDAFQINVRLLHPSAAPQLLLGSLLVLILAGVYPALTATRQDPLDVLEPKTA